MNKSRKKCRTVSSVHGSAYICSWNFMGASAKNYNMQDLRTKIPHSLLKTRG